MFGNYYQPRQYSRRPGFFASPSPYGAYNPYAPSYAYTTPEEEYYQALAEEHARQAAMARERQREAAIQRRLEEEREAQLYRQYLMEEERKRRQMQEAMMRAEREKEEDLLSSLFGVRRRPSMSQPRGRTQSPAARPENVKISVPIVEEKSHSTPTTTPAVPTPTATSTNNTATKTQSHPRREYAAKLIQSTWRTHHLTHQRLTTLSTIHSRLESLKSNFVFPLRLDFAPTSTEDAPKLLYTSTNAPVHAYENELTKVLTQLDEVESHGLQRVREERKRIVAMAERELEELDKRKIEVWKSMNNVVEKMEVPVEETVVSQPEAEVLSMDDKQIEEQASESQLGDVDSTIVPETTSVPVSDADPEPQLPVADSTPTPLTTDDTTELPPSTTPSAPSAVEEPSIILPPTSPLEPTLTIPTASTEAEAEVPASSASPISEHMPNLADDTETQDEFEHITPPTSPSLRGSPVPPEEVPIPPSVCGDHDKFDVDEGEKDTEDMQVEELVDSVKEDRDMEDDAKQPEGAVELDVEPKKEVQAETEVKIDNLDMEQEKEIASL